MREHAQLLSSVRDVISEYKIDDVISQAQATRAALGSQRALFGDVQGKVKQLSDKFPVIRGLLGSIKGKRSRNTHLFCCDCCLYVFPYHMLAF
ncbi:Golgi SNAP receptor complex member 1-2 [Striga hermonthica]|uniref:Golgi SNAP receptor complex member 1-2 n=1 Tax=Striga hermonthica TaxID=68872 RepID=A0A9N7MUI9_STRHE|nr:Golgi SNAP receptor complex member 1-2 [Striga hermonthica]